MSYYAIERTQRLVIAGPFESGLSAELWCGEAQCPGAKIVNDETGATLKHGDFFPQQPYEA